MINFKQLKSKFSLCWSQFWFAPASSRPLAGLRILLGLVLLWQVYMLRDVGFELLSRDGIVQGDLADQLSSSVVFRIQDLKSAFPSFGWSESTWIAAVCYTYTAALVMMILGLLTPIATAVCWFLHWTLMSTAFSTAYGVDLFAHVFLFYLMWMPSFRKWSVDRLFLPQLAESSIGSRIALRVLQLHLCIMYFSSGIEKALGIQWWNGELMWRSLNLPVYRVFDFTWLADYPHLAQIGGIATLIVEIGYIVFIWPKKTRWPWIIAVIGMHIGIAIFLGLTLFGVAMAILTLSIFGISADPNSTRWFWMPSRN